MDPEERKVWQRERVRQWREKNRERYRELARDYYARKKAKERATY
jgi:hypothetical protein